MRMTRSYSIVKELPEIFIRESESQHTHFVSRQLSTNQFQDVYLGVRFQDAGISFLVFQRVFKNTRHCQWLSKMHQEAVIF